jgi:hypothetical protein
MGGEALDMQEELKHNDRFPHPIIGKGGYIRGKVLRLNVSIRVTIDNPKQKPQPLFMPRMAASKFRQETLLHFYMNCKPLTSIQYCCCDRDASMSRSIIASEIVGFAKGISPTRRIDYLSFVCVHNVRTAFRRDHRLNCFCAFLMRKDTPLAFGDSAKAGGKVKQT